MKRRLQHTIAPVLLGLTLVSSALLVSGCMTDVEDEYADETDDLGFVQHDLGAQMPSGEGEAEEDDGRVMLPTGTSSVDVADEQFNSLFEPQPQPWDGEEGMQESGNGDQSGE